MNDDRRAQTRSTDPRIERVVAVYESLTRDRLDALTDLFKADGRFIDPFNDVTGHAAIRRVFDHMYEQLQSPRFEVLSSAVQGDEGFLLWNLHYRTRGGQPQRVHGMSRLVFAADGQVSLHHDHWDPARQLYEDVPVLGSLMRWIRRRLSADAC